MIGGQSTANLAAYARYLLQGYKARFHVEEADELPIPDEGQKMPEKWLKLVEYGMLEAKHEHIETQTEKYNAIKNGQATSADFEL